MLYNAQSGKQFSVAALIKPKPGPQQDSDVLIVLKIYMYENQKTNYL